MTFPVQQTVPFDDVADLYDYYVRTEFDLDFWLTETLAASGKVLELACGTGRVSIPLLKAGVDLTCVDYAPGMLSVLRGKLEAQDLWCPIYCRDMAELTLPYQYSLIFIPFHSFSEIVERDRQRQALDRVYEHLSNGGTFICSLQNLIVHAVPLNGTARLIGEFPTEDGNLLDVRSQMTYNDATQIATGVQVYQIRSVDGTLIERRSLNLSFYLFRKTEFEALAAEAGFEIVALYGDYNYQPYKEGTSPFMIWKLKKNPA